LYCFFLSLPDTLDTFRSVSDVEVTTEATRVTAESTSRFDGFSFWNLPLFAFKGSQNPTHKPVSGTHPGFTIDDTADLPTNTGKNNNKLI
jgi:hypothetical protein